MLDNSLGEGGSQKTDTAETKHYQKHCEYSSGAGEGVNLAETNGGNGDDGHIQGIEQAELFNDYITNRPDDQKRDGGENANGYFFVLQHRMCRYFPQIVEVSQEL